MQGRRHESTGGSSIIPRPDEINQGRPLFDRKLGSWEAGSVKTTLDLPDELVREMKLKAAHEGRKIKDVVASLIAAGIVAESKAAKVAPGRKGKLKLPLFPSAKNPRSRKVSMEQILALTQSTQTSEDLARLGLSV